LALLVRMLAPSRWSRQELLYIAVRSKTRKPAHWSGRVGRRDPHRLHPRLRELRACRRKGQARHRDARRRARRLAARSSSLPGPCSFNARPPRKRKRMQPMPISLANRNRPCFRWHRNGYVCRPLRLPPSVMARRSRFVRHSSTSRARRGFPRMWVRLNLARGAPADAAPLYRLAWRRVRREPAITASPTRVCPSEKSLR